MKPLKEVFVKEIVHDELDLKPPFYIRDKEGDGDRQEIIYSDEVNWQDAPSIDIETIIAALHELQAAGADRVYLFAHSDHHGYHLTGVRLVEAAEEDIQTERQKYLSYMNKKLAEARRQVEALEKAIRENELP